jgi:hypothetical protein
MLHPFCTAASHLVAASAAFAAGSSTASASLLLLLLHLLLSLPLQRGQGADHAAHSLTGTILLRRL